MSEAADAPVTITIGEIGFRIRVPADQEPRYREIELRTNAALREILESGVVGGPRAMAMAAFQLAAELHDHERHTGSVEQGRARLAELIHKLDQATGGAR